MASSTIDHLVSLTVFLGALLLFTSLFNQLIQTAILYQRHRYLATRCSDLLDNMLLNPGSPSNATFHWGRSNCTPTSFGLQDPQFMQYRLSPFSLMRLNYSEGEPVYYSKTGQYYSNITMEFGRSLMVPFNEAINYSMASRLLGINGTFGFGLSITPIVTVSIEEVQPNPLELAVNVIGIGFPLADANISYCFITVEGQGVYPSYNVAYGSAIANGEGSVSLSFPSVDGTEESYVIIVYAYQSGLAGVGCYEHVTYDECYLIPLIDDFDARRVLLAHSWDMLAGSNPAEISYNATFVLLTEDFTLREVPLDNATGKVGKINYGEGKPYDSVTIPTYDPGILVITYRKSAQELGVVLMPWGISSMAFPIVFGDNPFSREWVATDMRQVIVTDIAYQARLALWSLEAYQVVG